MVDESRLVETIEYVAIRRLQRRYADIVTRQAWDELAGIMRPDCTLALDLGEGESLYEGPEAIGRFIAGRLELFDFFQFVILNTVVEIAGSSAAARLYIQELRQDVAEGKRSDTFGVYHDRLEQDATGRWWFAARRYASYARTASGGRADLHVVGLTVEQLDPFAG